MPSKEELTEDEYKDLKRQVDNAKAEAQRAKGALDQQMTQLQNDFDCSSLKEAKTLLAELEDKRDKAADKFNKLAKEYEKKWKS